MLSCDIKVIISPKTFLLTLFKTNKIGAFLIKEQKKIIIIYGLNIRMIIVMSLQQLINPYGQ